MRVGVPRYDSLTLTTSFPESPDDPSGHFVLSEVRERAMRGGDHLVLAPGARRDELITLRDATVAVERLGAERAFGWPGVLSRVRESPHLFVPALALLRRMRARLHRADASAIVAHWLLPCGLMALEDGRPSTLWAHGSDVRLLTRSRAAARGFAELLLRRPSELVFVAEHLLETLARALPAELWRAVRARSSVRPAPIEVEVHTQGGERLPPGDFIAWVGRFISSKDPAMAARIAARHRLTLVMVGDGPACVAPSPFVIVLGRLPRAEALAVIARSRALLSTSREEGLSTVAREAIALGTPVYALRTRGIQAGPDTQLFETEEALGRALESHVRGTA